MDLPESDRRRFAIALASLGLVLIVPDAPSVVEGEAPTAATGAVLAADGGEQLIHFRDGGDIFIKAGAAAGSPDLAIGTQHTEFR